MESNVKETARRVPDLPGQGSAPAAMLELADPDVPLLPELALDALVFDIDAARGGRFGGFFMADDAGAGRYLFPNAPAGDEWRSRVSASGRLISGFHLPRDVRFALVAAGPLMWLAGLGAKAHYRFEAVVFCNEVLDKESKEPALIRLVISGVPAVKLHQFMVLDINEPLERITQLIRSWARRSLDDGAIERNRYQRLMDRRATPQMIWLPVSVRLQAPVGRNKDNATAGAVPEVDRLDGRAYRSLWPAVPTDLLVTPDTENGLLMTGRVQEFCRDRRRLYERKLRGRAKWKVRYELASIVQRDTEIS